MTPDSAFVLDPCQIHLVTTTLELVANCLGHDFSLECQHFLPLRVHWQDRVQLKMPGRRRLAYYENVVYRHTKYQPLVVNSNDPQSRDVSVRSTLNPRLLILEPRPGLRFFLALKLRLLLTLSSLYTAKYHLAISGMECECVKANYLNQVSRAVHSFRS